MTAEIPSEDRTEIERLTRLAHTTSDPNDRAVYRERRDELAAELGFETRLREGGATATLVLYPADWIVDGELRRERIDDLDDAHEIPLEGPGDPDRWSELAAANDRVVERVDDEHGEVHAENADALATFANNHTAKPIEALSRAELSTFLEEYYVRNAWTSDDADARVRESVRRTLDAAGVPEPGDRLPSESQ